MVVVDDLLVQLRIEIQLWNVSPPNKIKIPFSFTFEIIFTIIPDYFNTNTYEHQTMFGGALSILHVKCADRFHLKKSNKETKISLAILFNLVLMSLIRSMGRCSHSGNSSKTTGIIFQKYVLIIKVYVIIEK
jgi:hypothetical protein